MATVTSDAVARDESTFKSFPSGQVGYRTGSISITKTQMETAAEVMQVVPVYKGETVLSVTVSGAPLSTGADITVNVGDGTAADRFIAANATFQSAGASLASSIGAAGYRYTADDTIDITWGTEATTGSTGPVTLTVEIIVA